jgi:hypothetical protein
MSDIFHIPNGLKGKRFNPSLCDFASEYVIKKVKEKQGGLKLNGTHQLLVYVDDVNLFC